VGEVNRLRLYRQRAVNAIEMRRRRTFWPTRQVEIRLRSGEVVAGAGGTVWMHVRNELGASSQRAVRFETNDYSEPVADGLGPEQVKGSCGK
jgi:hypothetical protein